MSAGLSEFAVAGDLGTDVFWRVEERNQRRYRYECIATVLEDDTTVRAYHPHAEAHPDEMRAALAKLRKAECLNAPVRLGDAASFPAGGAGLALFQHLDFFRMWQLAEQEIHRVSQRLAAKATLSGPEISAVLRLLLDFNRLRRATPLIEAVTPQLLEAAKSGKDDRWQNTGYALRMIGDMHLRMDAPMRALAAYEAALELGDNAHRRGLAIRAAEAAQDHAAARRHLDHYASRWDLPEPLARLQQTLASKDTGELT